MPDGRRPRLPHVAALDGIRALAVAGVVLYHAGVGRIPGGFLGVDVFFVLSGFLITSLLLQERRTTGFVDLRRFWVRRARRLLPAAFLVIGVCALVAVAFLDDGARTRGDALASLGYVNNWHQLGAGTSYFASFERPSLLLHLWSLSVEEQFYLLWPLALGLLLRRGRGVAATVTVAGGVASALAMALVFDPGADPTRVYFGTDTHAFGLLAGAALAFAWPLGQRRGAPSRVGGVALEAAALAGTAGVVVLMLTLHDYDPWAYRGAIALAVLCATALVAGVSHPACRTARIYAGSVPRWIGARSYGIYLWHWPVMALTRPDIDLRWPAWILVPAQIALTVLLAAASYRWVEQPIRTGSGRAWLDARRPRGRLALAASTGLALAGALAFVALHDAGPAPAASRAVPAALLRPATVAVAPPTVRRAPAARPAASPAAGTRRAGSRRALAVGASVMLAARAPLSRYADVDAAVGRQPKEIVARLQELRGAHRLTDRVVVQMGENGPVWGADIRALHRVLRGIDRVVLVNVRVARSWEDEVNGILAETAGAWKEARLADWHDASARAGLLYGDGTHPNAAGGRVYARLVRRALRG